MNEPQKKNELHQKPDSRHVPALDGVRGVAIAMVVAFHSGLILDSSSLGEKAWLKVASIGWAGVDLFFVLSGFLITTILIQTRDEPRYFRNFFMRRVLRIFPLYFGSLLLLFSQLDDRGQQMWYWLFAQNWISVFEGLTPAQPLALQPYWSLAVEEQFYLVWPLVICLLRPRQIPLFCVLTSLVALTARCVAKSQGVEVWTVMTVTPFRLDALALGGLVASCRLSEQRTRLTKFAPFVLAGCLVALIVIGFVEGGFHGDRISSQTIGYSLFALMCAALIAMVVEEHPLAKLPRRLLEWEPLRHLGNRSYCIYVVHMPVLVFMRSVYVRRLQEKDTGTSDVQAFIFAVATCLILAELSWHLYEKQFLKLKRRFPRGDEPVAEADSNATVSANTQ
ncbi:MAG: acyltransferase [Planctomycetes bacterium]|nr:acyltransferase [Planctomycetota bacterium]